MSGLPSALCSPFTKLSYRILARFDLSFRRPATTAIRSRGERGNARGEAPMASPRTPVRQARVSLFSLPPRRCILLLHFLYLYLPPPPLSLSLSLSLSRSSIRRRCYVAVRLVIVIVACSPLNRSPKFESSRTFHVLRFLSASLRFDEALRDLCREQRVAYDLAQSITIRPPIERPEKSGCRV